MQRPEHGAMRIAPAVVMAYRAAIGAERVLVLADIQVKYAEMLAPRALAESARLAREAGADAIVVTGTRTGEAPSEGELADARAGAGDCPILIGSGLAPRQRPGAARSRRRRDRRHEPDARREGDARAGARRVGSARVKFVCAADCGVDRYGERGIERAGGIGLNVAVHLRRLCAAGDTVTLVAPIGADAGGAVVRDAIARSGVEPCLEVVPGATPVQHIRHAAGGERIFERYDEGVLTGYRASARQCQAIAAADVLATAAFGQGLVFFESVMACRPPGLRAVDFTNANDVGDPIAFTARWAPELDVGLFGLQPSDAALIDGLEKIAQSSGRLFVVTLGAAGAIALSAAPRLACAARTVADVADTTGAGDAFTAGFLWEYARSRDVGRSLARGSEVAASTLHTLGSFELP